MTTSVFVLGASLEEDRPEISFEIAANANCVNWARVGEVADGTIDVTNYEIPHLIVESPDALSWDFYRCSGTLGVVSRKAAEILTPHGRQCLRFLDVFINMEPYAMIGIRGTVDVLDRDHTQGKRFPHDPTRYMRFDRFAFHKSKIDDPSVFVIPEAPSYLFCSHSVPSLVSRNNLKGFRFTDAEKSI